MLFEYVTPVRTNMENLNQTPLSQMSLSLESQLRYTQLLYVAEDSALNLDLLTPNDERTYTMTNNFYKYQNLMADTINYMENNELNQDDIQMIEQVINTSTVFIDAFRFARLFNHLSFLDSDDEGEGWVPDLTEQGVEPNPGPGAHSTLRYNRSSKDTLQNVKALAKAAHYEPAVSKLAARAAKSGRKNIRVSDTALNDFVAQIGASYTEVKQEPPPECPRCHQKYCDCMGKRAALSASIMSMISSLVKIIETLMTTTIRAQVGDTFISKMIFGNKGATGTVADAVKDAVEDMMEAKMPGINCSYKTVLKSLCIFAVLYFIYKTGKITYEIISGLVAIIFAQNSNVAQIANAWIDKEGLESFIDSTGEGSWFKYVPIALSLMLSGLVAFAVGKIPGRDNTPTGWMSKISAFPRACSAQKDIFTTIQNYTKPLWNKFEIEILGHDATLLDDAIPQISGWMAEIEYYSNKAVLDRACLERTGRFKIASLYAHGTKLLLQYQPALTTEYRQAAQRALGVAAKLKTFVENNHPEVKNVRNAPLAIWLVGESQIGKSRLQYLISTELCMAAGLTDVNDQIYMRCADQDFWDGYMNQFVCVWDDFGQQKDTSANPNVEFFEIIRAVGPFPYPLHMADLSSKSSTRFTSGVVMCSTNNRNLNVESLTYEDAVWNRFGQSWEVKLKPEFCRTIEGVNGTLKQVLDISKVRANKPGWEINPYIYDFVKFDARRRKEDCPYTGEIYQWEEFIQELKRDLLYRMEDGSKLDDWLTQYAKGNVAQVGRDDVFSIFAQNGKKGIPSSKHTLGEFLDWLGALTHDPVRDSTTMLTMYKAYAQQERVECNGDPYKTKLVDYETICVPDDLWDTLIIAFLRDSETSWTKRTMEYCSACAAETYEKLPVVAKQILSTVKSWVSDAISGTFAFMKEYKYLIAGLFSLALFKGYFTSKNEAESDPRVLQPRARAAARAIGRSKIVRSSKNAEMGQSINQLDAINKVRRQQYLMIAEYSDSRQKALGCVTNIAGTIFMMPRHFHCAMLSEPPRKVIFMHSDSDKIAITRNFSGLFEDICFAESDDGSPMDVCFFSMSEFMRGKNIATHFASDDDLARMHERRMYATMSGINYDPRGCAFTTASSECVVMRDSEVKYLLEANSTEVVATSIIKYQIPTKFGDCGKLISMNTDAVSGRFVGMHVSGSPSGWNYAQVVTRELITDAIESFPSRAQICLSLPSVDEVEVSMGTGVLNKGKLKVNVSQASNTCIKPSKLHGMITPPSTAPALLRPKVIDGVLHDPLVEGAKKAGRPCGIIPEDVLDMAVDDVLLRVSAKNPTNVDIRVLSYEEAIQGIPGDELFQPINRTTSPGFPYMTHEKPLSKKGKTNWMGRFEYDFESEQAQILRRDVDDILDKCRNDKPYEVIWIDTLKDERRALEKVACGKTRIISNGPMHFNIAFRMYFMAALAHLRAGRIDNGIAVGINVWSSEWNYLGAYLEANSDKMIDGDFKEFDGTLMDQVMWRIFHILDSLYDDGNTNIRRNLWYHAVYATRSCRGVVYQCTHSLPSGFVATAEANSLYVNIIFRCVYLMLARESDMEKASMTAFNNLVRLVAYGDDNILSIKPNILEWFNMVTVIKAMKQIGLDYTPADKSDVIVPFKGIGDISFLKRSFKKVPSVGGKTPIYMCPADLETRLEMLNWTKKNGMDATPEEAMVVGDVIKELSMHGTQVYNEWVPKIVKAATQVGITGYSKETCYHYHHMVIAGNSAPYTCDLPVRIQNTDENKTNSIAACESGGSVYSYTLGSPGAAPHHPRERQCGARIKRSSF